MTLQEIQAQTAATLVKQAETIGSRRSLLLMRLREARSVLTDQYLAKFGKDSTFDFDNKRLVSTCGTYALQWNVRMFPEEPVSYNNQQTSRGSVTLLRIV